MRRPTLLAGGAAYRARVCVRSSKESPQPATSTAPGEGKRMMAKKAGVNFDLIAPSLRQAALGQRGQHRRVYSAACSAHCSVSAVLPTLSTSLGAFPTARPSAPRSRRWSPSAWGLRVAAFAIAGLFTGRDLWLAIGLLLSVAWTGVWAGNRMRMHVAPGRVFGSPWGHQLQREFTARRDFRWWGLVAAGLRPVVFRWDAGACGCDAAERRSPPTTAGRDHQAGPRTSPATAGAPGSSDYAGEGAESLICVALALSASWLTRSVLRQLEDLTNVSTNVYRRQSPSNGTRKRGGEISTSTVSISWRLP